MHFLENLRFTSMQFYIVNSTNFELSFGH